MRLPPSHLRHPRHWPLWFLIAGLWVVAQLPYRAQMAIGRGLGLLAFYSIKSRRHVADRNLELCFPDLSAADRAALLRAHFASLGMGIIEVPMSWWAPARRLNGRLKLEGLEHLHAVQQRGQGAILLSGHFTSIDICGRLFAPHADVDILFRPQDNPVIEHYLGGHRKRRFRHAIERHDIRGMVRALRQGRAIWYAPDQNYRGNNSALVPFFGHLAPTHTGTARLARLSGAAVLPFYMERCLETGTYLIRIEPPLKDFPSQDPVADTDRQNRILEAQIRHCPAQYLWVHERFKKRPAPLPDVYARELPPA
ncbi:MAG TPA: lipid A biosynthesis lauroyl acyltransferase [Gammaproteobacteria bacterium]|nr:lipid A biosynthesis lauroyl acyltransferase [Gammaproteobacteria bacterium]